MKVNQLIIAVLCVFSINTLSAQIYNSSNGARANGMGGAVVALSDVWSIQNNVAGIADIEDFTTAVAFQNRFGVTGINYMSFASVKPMKFGSFGVSFDRSGNKNLSEQRIGLGYGHTIDNVSLGGKVNLVQVAMAEIGTRTALALEFGGIAKLGKQVVFGANIYNLNKAKMANYMDERLSTVLKAGISYQPFEKLKINAESEKNMEYEADYKIGLEYEVLEDIYFRSGFSTLASAGYYGLGIKKKNFCFDYALNSHTYLGFSNHISLGYVFKK